MELAVEAAKRKLELETRELEEKMAARRARIVERLKDKNMNARPMPPALRDTTQLLPGRQDTAVSQRQEAQTTLERDTVQLIPGRQDIVGLQRQEFQPSLERDTVQLITGRQDIAGLQSQGVQSSQERDTVQLITGRLISIKYITSEQQTLPKLHYNQHKPNNQHKLL